MQVLKIDIEARHIALAGEDRRDFDQFEAARLIRKVANRVEADGVGSLPMPLNDINGRPVGRADLANRRKPRY